ncbi:hypothetical protein [Palaeococcus ferrophilus]|uniref:hypothetical protein n=1 Tax=Palaeococcus ferrophilus TaxID=83868 RepID=UPI00064E300A|nr:hypothetical protein [Palaeococcus ferrophilus]
MDWGAVTFFAIMALLVAMVLVGNERKKRAMARCQRLAESIRVEEGRIILPGEMKLKRGRLRIRGEWHGSKNRHYYVSREFTGIEDINAEEIPLSPEPFSVAINGRDTALADFPAYLVTEGEFRGSVLVPILPSYEVKVEKDTLEASRELEFAHTRVESLNNAISGTLYVNVAKCRGARLELEIDGPRAKEMLAEVEGSGEAGFERKFWSEPLLLVMDRSQTDPRKLREVFGRREFVEGHWEYTLKLTLDVPFSKDEHDTTKVVVGLGKGAMGGKPRVESVV